jgi:putative Mn2+ efflux pump MntP
MNKETRIFIWGLFLILFSLFNIDESIALLKLGETPNSFIDWLSFITLLITLYLGVHYVEESIKKENNGNNKKDDDMKKTKQFL